METASGGGRRTVLAIETRTLDIPHTEDQEERNRATATELHDEPDASTQIPKTRNTDLDIRDDIDRGNENGIIQVSLKIVEPHDTAHPHDDATHRENHSPDPDPDRARDLLNVQGNPRNHGKGRTLW